MPKQEEGEAISLEPAYSTLHIAILDELATLAGGHLASWLMGYHQWLSEIKERWESSSSRDDDRIVSELVLHYIEQMRRYVERRIQNHRPGASEEKVEKLAVACLRSMLGGQSSSHIFLSATRDQVEQALAVVLSE